MRHRTLTFAANESLLKTARARWGRPIVDAWPRASRPPGVELVPLEEFLKRGEGARRPSASGPEGPAVVILDADRTRAQAAELADSLKDSPHPVLLLCPGSEWSTDQIETGGLLVQSWDADPARLAAMLYALAERQELVHTLARDLRIAQSSQGGMRGEMERIHEEMHLAAAVQREMLPLRVPELPGLEFATLFRPMGYVSGDIYDFRQIDEHRIAFLVADAVGHGVPAALLTIALCRSLTSRDREGNQWRPLEPAEALARLNRELCTRQTTPHRFATAIYGWVDARTRTVTVAGAGHPAPMVFGRGASRQLETQGPLLGVFEDACFDQVSTVLEPGETFVVYTDGIESAFPDKSGAARNRVKPTNNFIEHLRVMAEHARRPGASLAEAAQVLVAALDDQAGSLHQIDDITALAICAPVAAPALAA